MLPIFGVFQDEEDDDSGDDFGELHEQFAAQEKLLGELRGVLKSNEKKLETKEKVVKVRNAAANTNNTFNEGYAVSPVALFSHQN